MAYCISPIHSEPPAKLNVVPYLLHCCGTSLQFGPAGSPENTAPMNDNSLVAPTHTRTPGVASGYAGPPLIMLAARMPAQPKVPLIRPPAVSPVLVPAVL